MQTWEFKAVSHCESSLSYVWNTTFYLRRLSCLFFEIKLIWKLNALLTFKMWGGHWGALSMYPFPVLEISAMNLKRIALNCRGRNREVKKTCTSLIFQQSGLCVFSMCIFISKVEVLKILKWEGRKWQMRSRARHNPEVRRVICRAGINRFLQALVQWVAGTICRGFWGGWIAGECREGRKSFLAFD